MDIDRVENEALTKNMRKVGYRKTGWWPVLRSRSGGGATTPPVSMRSYGSGAAQRVNILLFRQQEGSGGSRCRVFRGGHSQLFHRAAEAGDWVSFVEQMTAILREGAADSDRKGCPLALMGMELALSEPELARSYAEGMKRLRAVMRSG